MKLKCNIEILAASKGMNQSSESFDHQDPRHLQGFDCLQISGGPGRGRDGTFNRFLKCVEAWAGLYAL